MSAELVGVGFTIKPLSPEQQKIASGFPTVWRWSVEAKDHGEQELEATLYALFEGANSTPQRVDSYTQKITVSVRALTLGEWLEAFGKQFDVLKTIVVALFGAATIAAGWIGWRKKKMNAPIDEQSSPTASSSI
jgi:hypothetical protein